VKNSKVSGSGHCYGQNREVQTTALLLITGINFGINIGRAALKWYLDITGWGWFCDRQSVGQVVSEWEPLWCLWPDFNFLTFDNYFLCSSCRASSLTRRRVCSWQCKHSLVRVAQNPQPYINASSEARPTWRARSLYLNHPGTGWPSYTPEHWVPFSLPLRTRRAAVEVL
jgi:hypothetical protein